MFENIQEILRRLKVIEAEIRHLQKRIESLEKKKSVLTKPPIVVENLLKLPYTLRRTAVAMLEQKEAIAESVAKKTKRSRGMESIYLNQLARMGFLEKTKKGRRTYFRTREE